LLTGIAGSPSASHSSPGWTRLSKCIDMKTEPGWQRCPAAPLRLPGGARGRREPQPRGTTCTSPFASR